MKTAETIAKNPAFQHSKIRDFAVLFKLRLTFLVVVSSVLGYFMAVDLINWADLLALIAGGFLLTGSSNAFNQIWEKETDKIMERTMRRPLPQGRLLTNEALIAGILAGLSGISILWFLLNPLCGILGMLALVTYVFLYTPLKPLSSLAVFVGAFPGAIPPMLGYIAGSGRFGLEPGLLFAVQFMWQFPHFWAIAWVANDDYQRAGFRMLPFYEGRTRRSAFQILAYSLFLIPVSLLPWMFPIGNPMTGNWAMVASLIGGIWFAWMSWKLYRSQEISDAKRLMFTSFLYLPVVQMAYVLDKL